MIENAKCQNCGACLIIDTNLHKGKCSYCGGEVIIKDAVERIKIESIDNFDNLLLCAQNELEYANDFDNARHYYKQAIILKANDYRPLWGIFLCEIESIIWAYNRKGFVQIPGDVQNSIIDAIQRYGMRAYNFAPNDVKKYYKEYFDTLLKQI